MFKFYLESPKKGRPQISAGDWMSALEEGGQGRGCVHLGVWSFSDPLIASRCCCGDGLRSTDDWAVSQRPGAFSCVCALLGLPWFAAQDLLPLALLLLGERKGGSGFGAGQEQLGPSCSGHGILKAQGLKNHAQTASDSSASLSVYGSNFPGKVWRKREWTWIGCQSQTASGLEY